MQVKDALRKWPDIFLPDGENICNDRWTGSTAVGNEGLCQHPRINRYGELFMNYETLLKTATSRRSIRKFKEDAVSRDDIEKIVRVGMQAPSGFNSQPWDIVVVDDKSLKDKVTQCLLDGIGEGKTSKGFINAPAFILLYGDTRLRDYGPPGRKDDDQWWEFTFNTSLSNFFMYMQLAATSLGLGSMWVSSFKNPEIDKPTKELLKIPSHFTVFEMMAIGHPDIEPGEKKLREVSDILHYNQDGNYRTKEDIDKWFNHK